MGRPRRLTGERAESAVQILILLGVGGMAGAVSFVHVHDWTVHNGQLSWVGWTNAVITELIQIACGLELRRRKRSGQRTGFVITVMVTAVMVSLTAQVSQASPTVSGWIVAALPAVAFLTVVKIVMARSAPVSAGRHAVTPDLAPAVDQRADLAPDQPDRAMTAPPVTDVTAPGPDPVTPEVLTAADRTNETVPAGDPVTPTDVTADPLAEFDRDLVALGRAVLADLKARDEAVNRGTFAMTIRRSGTRIATDKAGALLIALRKVA